MSAIRTYLALAAMLPCVTGCVAVSMHSTRPVEVRVTDRTTGKPVRGADVSVAYAYTSYGIFHVFRVPKPATARTDASGAAVIPLATFSYDISFYVAGTHFLVTPDLIRHGGFPSGSYWSGGGQTGQPLVEHPPPIVVQLVPKT